MVITRLDGGLGNQLFQYAAGRALSLARDVQLALDTSRFGIVEPGITPRQYALTEFRIAAKIASREEVSLRTQPRGIVRRAFGKIAPLNSRSAYYEKSLLFDARLLRLSGNVYIGGHWQSEKYFSPVAAQIREDLRLRNPFSADANRLAQAIAASEHPVAIHVRRGDYLSNPAAAKHHGVLDVSYYNAAIDEIRHGTPGAVFFVFSDDPQWVHTNLSAEFIRAVDAGNRSDAEDLTLISHCRDHVISNSSFGWWGAWLSRYAQKRVVAPARWFADKSLDTRDIIPNGWLRR